MRIRSALFVFVVLLAAGCGDTAEDEVTEATEATATQPTAMTSQAPATTTTAASTPTAITSQAPATTTTAASTTTTEAATTTTAEAPTTTTEAATTTTTMALPTFDPLGVVFSVDFDEEVGTLDFTASGAAVDAGAVCSAGTGFRSTYELTGFLAEWNYRFQCDDESGNFSLSSDSSEKSDASTDVWYWAGPWVLTDGSGTGAYTEMAGEGSGTGACEDEQCLEEYAGQLWRTG